MPTLSDPVAIVPLRPQPWTPSDARTQATAARVAQMRLPGAATVAKLLETGTPQLLALLLDQAAAKRETHPSWSRGVRVAVGLAMQRQVLRDPEQPLAWSPLFERLSAATPLPSLQESGHAGLRARAPRVWERAATDQEDGSDAVGKWSVRACAELRGQLTAARAEGMTPRFLALEKIGTPGRVSVLVRQAQDAMTAWAATATPDALAPFAADPDQWPELLETAGRLSGQRFPAAWVATAPVAFQRGWTFAVFSDPMVRQTRPRDWRLAVSLAARALRTSDVGTWRNREVQDDLSRWAPNAVQQLSRTPLLVDELRARLLVTTPASADRPARVRPRPGTAAGVWSMLRWADFQDVDRRLQALVVDASLALHHAFRGEDVVPLWRTLIRRCSWLTPEDLARYLAQSPSLTLREVISEVPQFQHSVELQTRLATTQSTRLQRRVIAKATDAAALDRSLTRLASQEPALVLRTLETRPEALASASPAVFRPLLAQPEREQRVAAVRLVGQQQEHRAAAATAPTATRDEPSAPAPAEATRPTPHAPSAGPVRRGG